MTDNIKILTLKILSSDDGKWNWYRLDRALSAEGWSGGQNLVALANELARDGLIDVVNIDGASLPIYKITEKGRSVIES